MHALRILVAAAGFAAASAALAAPTILNGSLTGPIANNGVPAGWNIVNGSPDTMDQTANVGVPGSVGAAFVAGPTASNDGGTWVGIGRDGNFIETFGQLVGGFTVGAQYTLFWEHANFGVGSGLNYTGDNEIEVLLDGVSIGSGPVLGLDRLWHDESITFTATAASHRIDFQLGGLARSYHSIDGIGIRDAGQVPEPLSLSLVGLGLLGLAATRRRATA